MKDIMNSWRSYVSENTIVAKNSNIQKQIENLMSLPAFVKVYITSGMTGEKGEGYFEIKYHVPKEEVAKIESEFLSHGRRKRVGDVFPVGSIEAIAAHPQYDGYCEDAYVIAGAHASHGWGPLLYEVAIEYATRNAGGLAPDRTTVSQYALAVWDKYEARSDIEKAQLDVHYNYKGAMIDPESYPQLTPDYEADDCIQSAAIGKRGASWMDSSLSKVYRKNNTEVTDILLSLNRLVIEEK